MSRPFSRSEQAKEDDPPMSRLFIICNKATTEDDVRKAFDKFGEVEEIWMVKDKSTGDNKGIVYVKFTKTSAAAKALEEMNGKSMGSSNRSIKVLVASSRNQGSSRSDNEQEKYVRLFVIIPKDMKDEELDEEFRQYGALEHISVIRDRVTKERKGFAYIKYSKFSDAAIAYENCHPKYKAVFAEPRSTSNARSQNSKRMSNYDDEYYQHSGSSQNHRLNDVNNYTFSNKETASSGETQLNIICSTAVNQDQLWRLFDIIPGLDYCQITGDCGRNSNYATAVYTNADACAYAREKLHGLEYPPGERLIIKPISDLKGNSENFVFPFDGVGTKEISCSARLPEPAPLASVNAQCAQRCFVVCVPKALPQKLLMSIFCRFGNLIDVYMLPNKNCGYAKFATEQSAIKAIEVLNGIEVYGVKLKVLEAEEPRHTKRKRYEDE